MNVSINTVLMNTPFGGRLRVGEVYFIGIGGIGMSALARYFSGLGVKVSGYDKTPSALTRQLEAEGIAVHYEEDCSLMPLHPDFVVYTPAVPASHRELNWYKEKGIPVRKRSDVLEDITASSFNICIAGTHGKTTISTMIAHLLRQTGFGCNAFLGGIAVNYDSNFWGDPRNVCVVEADEYDRSFLKLHPDIAVISAMDADHLDIYGTVESLEEAFIAFSGQVKPGGLLFRRFGLKRGRELRAPQSLTYSLQNESADVYATDIRMEDGGYSFTVHAAGEKTGPLRLHMGGMHNVENAVVAVAVARVLGIEEEAIRDALAGFRGVKRRFEYIIRTKELVFIDDYAHHPEELLSLIRGARSLFPQRRCTVLFQPHLYSRTRDLADGFALALEEADQAILLPLYPAREEPIPGVDSGRIADRMKERPARVMNEESVLRWIQEAYRPSLNSEFGEVLITAGAGDIDRLVEPIRRLLTDNA